MKLSCKEKIRVKTLKTINVKFFKEIVMNSQGAGNLEEREKETIYEC